MIVKGAAEKSLLDITRSHSEKSKVYGLRPGGVVPDTPSFASNLIGVVVPTVKVTDLAKAFVHVALRGCSTSLIENSQIIEVAHRYPKLGTDND